MTQLDRERFAELCRVDRVLHGSDGDSIGTYNEKRLHRVLKRYITENAECYEVRTGRYVADVLENGTVTEIQTGSFRSLTAKVRYYLENTEYHVRVLHPVITEKLIIRANKDTGEVQRSARSPKRGNDLEALAEMYYLREFVGHERFCLCLMHVRAEEYRFSEAVRYRREGRYDNDLCPIELSDIRVLSTKEDYRRLVPKTLCDGEFTAAEFSSATKLKKRKLYSVLGYLTYIGVLDKRTEDRRNVYRVKE